VKLTKAVRALTAVALVAAIAIPALNVSASAATKKPVVKVIDAAKATSMKAFGTAANLATACKKEGKLNIIADPHDWANYGEIIAGFAKMYGVKMDEANPNGSSQDEINAANSLRGTKRAPDVFDLGQSVAYSNLNSFAAYKVAQWNNIPAAFKEPHGFLTKDYGGFMSVGYDSSLGTITKLDDLLGSAFAGKVALNGDPTKASAGQNGVFMTALVKGGTADDISAGVAWFKALKDAGNFINVDPTPATIASGQTPVVFDWDYNQAAVVTAMAKKGVTWKVFVPAGKLVGAYYNQAININAPHPACARAWMEYVFSPAGQNAWLRGGSRPVLAEYMAMHGTIDKKAYASLPAVVGTPYVLSVDQSKAANAYLLANWATAVGTR
jgi:putative spermidine/putrescine transport system substrate-binding protein